MMKILLQNKKTYLTLTLLSLLIKGLACGCYTYDYNSIQTNSYLGLFYNQRYHQGYNQSITSTGSLNSLHRIPSNVGDVKESNEDYERFQLAELRYNHAFGDWLNVGVSIPFVYNEDYYKTVYYFSNGSVTDAKHTESGIGDVFISAMLVSEKENENTTHTLKYGAGVYLPTGRHRLVDNEGNFIDPSHQPGRGTVNYLLQARHFMIIKERYGLTSSINYLFNSKGKAYAAAGNNSLQYAYGNQFTVYSNLFYKFFLGTVDLVPKLGLYYENIQNDYLNDYKMPDKGGDALMLNTGLDFKYKDLTVQTVFRIPLWKKLNGLQQETRRILNFGMIYAF